VKRARAEFSGAARRSGRAARPPGQGTPRVAKSELLDVGAGSLPTIVPDDGSFGSKLAVDDMGSVRQTPRAHADGLSRPDVGRGVGRAAHGPSSTIARTTPAPRT
jgi:hypothetical protein